MSQKEEKDILPLGSVVLLKGAKRYIVVIGYAMVDKENDKVWDYLGCAYPIGLTSFDKSLLFDHKQIDKIIYRGFLDEEGKEFIDKVKSSVGDES